jgi:hypothetical protein
MQLSFSTSWSLNFLNPVSNSAPIDCTTSIHSTQQFVMFSTLSFSATKNLITAWCL